MRAVAFAHPGPIVAEDALFDIELPAPEHALLRRSGMSTFERVNYRIDWQ